ncbi:predicted protein [Naegleria gruberi]|uniref:Predicted protein n=1 Tax=Naegleria gruberi TaxID=5762 RepID=D2V0T1_NAEGR|nr:uncharacterized protein NAEGRDRAFT_62405 [Naegleria gruberi]EFC49567.1 predicted protein [Naegleria gruberi]|eukprot:XP_002682311.1 predicted protein [Naegleria gruberi strain NEG-M]
MRDHCTPLSYLLDKYQHNLYLDTTQHHHHSFHSPFHHRKHHQTINNNNNNIELNDSKGDAGHSLHSTFDSTRTLNHHQQDETITTHEKPTLSTYKYKSNGMRSIPIQEQQQHDHASETNKKKEELLTDYMKRNQLRMVEAKSNGNCLFNSISLALFDGEHKNFQLRQLCVDWIEENLDSIVKDGIKIRDLIFLREDQSNISDYLHDMRQEKEWADYCCLNALANLLECELEVVYVNYQENEWIVKSEIQVEPINRPTGLLLTKIRLMYIEDLKHYNLLIKCK